MDSQYEVVADTTCLLGENPLWHAAQQRLYWTDIHTSTLYWYDPATGEHSKFFEDGLVGGFTMQENGALLLFMDHGAVRLWEDGKLTTLLEVIPGDDRHRFNDVAADPRGRVYCGTLNFSRAKSGNLYKLEPNGTMTTALTGIGISNGIGFSLDHTIMYYTDSSESTIYEYDYDEESGELSNRRIFATIDEPGQCPDGLTVDSKGGVWSAIWGGACVVRFTSNGHLERKIALPARLITSVIFGGADYEYLYITSAGGDKRSDEESHAGAVFRIKPDVPGLPEFPSKIAATAIDASAPKIVTLPAGT